MDKSIILQAIAESGMPALMKAMVVSFVKAMPQEKFDALFDNVVATGTAIMNNDPSASEKLQALGIPEPLAQNIMREARTRVEH